MSRRDNNKKNQNNKTKKDNNKKSDSKKHNKSASQPKPVTADDLDAALLKYMGESAQKVNLDDQLSSYFRKNDESVDA